MSQSGRDAGETLVVSDISKHFGGVRAISGVGLAVRRGELVSVIGPNGAGKTTTLKATSGLLYSERDEVTKGTVELDGERLDRLPPHDVVRRGVCQVFEGRRVFENLSVEENLIAGARKSCRDLKHYRRRKRWLS
ncbi:MAG: ATP-binding cassette domain-containing protein [Stellaceae bacterium]